MLSPKLACLALTVGLASGAVQALPYQNYNGQPSSPPMTLPNGAVAPQAALASMQANLPQGKKAVQIDKGIWQLSGFNFFNPTVVELERGLLVIESGERVEDGVLFRKIIREQISTKPIIAVSCTHSHYCKGTTGLLDGDSNVKTIAHKDMNTLMQAKGTAIGAVSIPELMPLAVGRSQIQFNHYMPKQGADAAYAVTLDPHAPSGFVTVNTPVDDGQVMQLDELKLQFFTEVMDDAVTITIYAPELGIVLGNNVLWAAIPNMYTLRGDTYRDPKLMVEAVQTIRDLQPKKVISTHFRPLLDAKSSLETLNLYMDGITSIYDQTIRLANRGVSPDELGHQLQLPKAVANGGVAVESYGQIEHFPRAIYDNAMGWFSGRAEDLHQLPRAEEARRLVALAGGADKVMAQYQDAMAKHEYLWASKLANYLRLTDPQIAEYRQALAASFREMGKLSYGTITRAFYITAAEALEGKQLVLLSELPTQPEVLADPLRYVDFLRTRIDPTKADGYEEVLQISLDGGAARALHVRDGAVEFVVKPDAHYRQPGVKMDCSKEAFAVYYRGETTPAEFVAGCKFAAGDAQQAAAFLDKFDPAMQASLY